MKPDATLEAASGAPDAIVVGAGPGGGSTAFHLAQAGRSVLLLDRAVFPRDKSCGDGLTKDAANSLSEMGVLARLPQSYRVNGVRLFLRGQGWRDSRYPPQHGGHGLVVPRRILDAAVCQRAVEEGAEFWQGADVRKLLYSNGRVAGVEVEHQGARKQLRSRMVVAADGASSLLARQAGLLRAASGQLGFAIRGYYSGIRDLSDVYEIYMPLLDVTDRYLLPSYGWVFPVSAGKANIGVGVFPGIRRANVRRLMERFVAFLTAEDPRFRSASPCAPWSGAPLRFDFTPQSCLQGGLLLVGDAAGLINPFTGEGISYALTSGKLAAHTIDDALKQRRTGTPDLSAYAKDLAQWYIGVFEAGRHSLRRYTLVWHVLESTFRNERPLFALCRRAVLAPAGMAPPLAPSSYENPAPLWHAPVYRLKSDLQSVSTLLRDAIRSEWPVIAQMAAISEQDLGILLRPAMLLLMCFYAGTGRDDRAVQTAAAVEFGCLAALAHSSIDDWRPDGSPDFRKGRADWGNLFALSLGDFLLSKAYEVGARVDPAILDSLSGALARGTSARIERREHCYNLDLPASRQLELVAANNSMLFETPCRLGAECGGLTPDQIDALARYGEEIGIIHSLVDEVLYIEDRAQLPVSMAADLADGVYGLTVRAAARDPSEPADKLRALLAQRRIGPDSTAEVRRLVRQTGAVAETIGLAKAARQRAQQALGALKRGPIRRALSGLAISAFLRLNR